MIILKSNKHYKGFCLSELIIAMTLIGILSALTYPMISSSMNASAMKEAKVRAHILNCAKESYRLRVGELNPDYARADDNTRFKLLAPYMRQNAQSLDTFCPKGYKFKIGPSIQSNVQLLDNSGQSITYLSE
jgi:prepilin-type N-terminal cleavage/methylation domain-containing protein